MMVTRDKLIKSPLEPLQTPQRRQPAVDRQQCGLTSRSTFCITPCNLSCSYRDQKLATWSSPVVPLVVACVPPLVSAMIRGGRRDGRAGGSRV